MIYYYALWNCVAKLDNTLARALIWECIYLRAITLQIKTTKPHIMNGEAKYLKQSPTLQESFMTTNPLDPFSKGSK
jgi:hypothetical protein